MSKTFKDRWSELSRGTDMEKNTVHITYDKNGVPVNSYVDEGETDKSVSRFVGDNSLRGKQGKYECKRCGFRSSIKLGNCPECSSSDGWIEKAMTNGEQDPQFNDTVEKPGPSIHTSKWDDCVREVQEKGNKVNAYAVCTAKLGNEAFKSEYRHLSYVKAEINKAQKEVEKMGIESAGSIPSSELSRQDLEGEAEESEARVQEEKDKLHEN